MSYGRLYECERVFDIVEVVYAITGIDNQQLRSIVDSSTMLDCILGPWLIRASDYEYDISKNVKENLFRYYAQRGYRLRDVCSSFKDKVRDLRLQDVWVYTWPDFAWWIKATAKQYGVPIELKVKTMDCEFGDSSSLESVQSIIEDQSYKQAAAKRADGPWNMFGVFRKY